MGRTVAGFCRMARKPRKRDHPQGGDVIQK